MGAGWQGAHPPPAGQQWVPERQQGPAQHWPPQQLEPAAQHWPLQQALPVGQHPVPQGEAEVPQTGTQVFEPDLLLQVVPASGWEGDGGAWPVR